MNAVTSPSLFLRTYLAPLLPFIERDDVTDIYVNRPDEVWLETVQGRGERHDVPGLGETVLWRLARQIASLSHQGISRAHPLLSAVLPDGARVQIAAPPAAHGAMAVAIRKHVLSNMDLGDYVTAGAFTGVKQGAGDHDAGQAELAALAQAADYAALLRTAVRQRRNILVSGGTSSGKTTFLNALLKEAGPHQRLITIEDAPELIVGQANAVRLIATRGELGEAQITPDDLLQAALRMRPDRIIVGELRGSEAYAFLRAVNTGHPGSMTTIHADSPQGAIDQLALIVLQSGTKLNYDDVVRYIRGVVDVYVQLGRDNGRRFVSKIMLRGDFHS